jgi:hypothetical protein
MVKVNIFISTNIKGNNIEIRSVITFIMYLSHELLELMLTIQHVYSLLSGSSHSEISKTRAHEDETNGEYICA